MTDEYRQSREFYASICAVLLAGDVKATVVENPAFLFVKVHLVSGGYVMWSLALSGEAGGWVFTSVDSDGDVTTGATDWAYDTEVEQVAKNIATFAYDEVVDFPMEHPADTELDFTQPVG